jgi:hypothetical protein
MNALKQPQERQILSKLHLVHEVEQFELPGLPAEFTRRPAPTEYINLAQPLAELAPGIWVCGTPEWEMPTHVVCKLVSGKEPGTWTLEPEVAPGWVRMSDDIGEKLGMRGLSHMTLRRLMQAGFVEHSRPAPGCIFIKLESLREHFRRTHNDCAEPSSFWTAERRRNWQETCGAHSNLED